MNTFSAVTRRKPDDELPAVSRARAREQASEYLGAISMFAGAHDAPMSSLDPLFEILGRLAREANRWPGYGRRWFLDILAKDRPQTRGHAAPLAFRRTLLHAKATLGLERDARIDLTLEIPKPGLPGLTAPTPPLTVLGYRWRPAANRPYARQEAAYPPLEELDYLQAAALLLPPAGSDPYRIRRPYHGSTVNWFG